MFKNLDIWKPACAEGGTVRLYQFDPEEKAWIDPGKRVVRYEVSCEVQEMRIATLPDNFFNRHGSEPRPFFLLLASKWGDGCGESIRQGRIIVILKDDKGMGKTHLRACSMVSNDEFKIETIMSPYYLCKYDIVVVM